MTRCVYKWRPPYVNDYHHDDNIACDSATPLQSSAHKYVILLSSHTHKSRVQINIERVYVPVAVYMTVNPATVQAISTALAGAL